MAKSNFERQITVDKEIVSLLSTSTYQRNFPYAVREIVSNAYDADATTVKIMVDQKADEISIEDNGNGMSLDQFDFYLRIAGRKRDKSDITPKFGRKRIGHFGIGFLAIFPFCEHLEITSTVENSDLIFIATIPAGAFFKSQKKDISVGEILINGYSYQDKNLKDEHFTRIKLIGLTERVKSYFSRRREVKRDSIRSLPPMEQLKWDLQEDLPLSYIENSPLSKSFSYEEPIALSVFLNGTELFRNELQGEILSTGEINEGELKAKYILATPWKSVHPYESRYLKLRVRNVGVGQRISPGIGERTYSRFDWLAGEVQILSGVDLTMNRDDFLESQGFEALKLKLGEIQRRWYDYIEDVDVSSKSMTKQVKGGKQVPVLSTREVVSKNVERLVKRGFEVKLAKGTGKADTNPVTVDKRTKSIVIYEDHPALDDTIKIGEKFYSIRYSTWPLDTDESPCRFGKDGAIEINQAYRPFASKRYGEIIRKVFIAALISKSNSRNTSSLYETLIGLLNEQFSSL